MSNWLWNARRNFRRLHLVRRELVALQRDADIIEGMEGYVSVPVEIWGLVMGRIVELMGSDDEVLGKPPRDLWKGSETRASEHKEIAVLREHLARAWALIANVSGGDWSSQSAEWREAAGNWERARNPYPAIRDKSDDQETLGK